MSTRRLMVSASLKGAIAGSMALSLYGMTLMWSILDAVPHRLSTLSWLLNWLKLALLVFPAALAVAGAVACIASRTASVDRYSFGSRERHVVLGVAGLFGLLPSLLLIAASVGTPLTVYQAKNVIVDLGLPTAVAAILGAMVFMKSYCTSSSNG